MLLLALPQGLQGCDFCGCSVYVQATKEPFAGGLAAQRQLLVQDSMNKNSQ